MNGYVYVYMCGYIGYVCNDDATLRDIGYITHYIENEKCDIIYMWLCINIDYILLYI